MQINYCLVQLDELTLVSGSNKYTKNEIGDNKELLSIFEYLEDIGMILFPVTKTELGGKTVLIAAEALRGNKKIRLEIPSMIQTIREV